MRFDVCRIWIISKADEMFYNLASFFKGLDIHLFKLSCKTGHTSKWTS